MPLNIYTIKHPLALSWVSCLSQQGMTNFEEFDLIERLILTLVYEATRKFIHINKIYLKKLDSLTTVNTISNKFEYCILLNSRTTQIAGKKILSFFPQAQIYNFPIDIINKYKKRTNCNIKILFIQELLDSDNTIRTLHMLYNCKTVTTDLQICSISCSSHALERINLSYPNLKIYTVGIKNS